MNTSIYESVVSYLSSIQSNFDDYAYDKISEIAEDYATEFHSFDEMLLKTFYYNKYKLITK